MSALLNLTIFQSSISTYYSLLMCDIFSMVKWGLLWRIMLHTAAKDLPSLSKRVGEPTVVMWKALSIVVGPFWNLPHCSPFVVSPVAVPLLIRTRTAVGYNNNNSNNKLYCYRTFQNQGYKVLHKITYKTRTPCTAIQWNKKHIKEQL